KNKERFADGEPVPASLARSCPRSFDFVRIAHCAQDDGEGGCALMRLPRERGHRKNCSACFRNSVQTYSQDSALDHHSKSAGRVFFGPAGDQALDYLSEAGDAGSDLVDRRVRIAEPETVYEATVDVVHRSRNDRDPAFDTAQKKLDG